MSASSTISGIAVDELSDDVRPQDDLFRHVNGRWLAEAEIPPDRAAHGAFHALADQSELDVRAILEQAAASDAPAGTDARKVGDLYGAFMDAEAIERLDAAPLADDLAEIRSVSSIADFTTLLGALERYDFHRAPAKLGTHQRGKPAGHVGRADDAVIRLRRYHGELAHRVHEHEAGQRVDHRGVEVLALARLLLVAERAHPLDRQLVRDRPHRPVGYPLGRASARAHSSPSRRATGSDGGCSGGWAPYIGTSATSKRPARAAPGWLPGWP